MGYEEVEVRQLGELSERERLEIEYDENARRKDHDVFEQRRILARLAELTREELRAGFRPGAGRNAAGRPREPGSTRAVAEHLGVPDSTIRDAERHVALEARYPGLGNLELYLAEKAARVLDLAPEWQRETIHQEIINLPPETHPYRVLKPAEKRLRADIAAGKTDLDQAIRMYPVLGKLRDSCHEAQLLAVAAGLSRLRDDDRGAVLQGLESVITRADMIAKLSEPQTPWWELPSRRPTTDVARQARAARRRWEELLGEWDAFSASYPPRRPYEQWDGTTRQEMADLTPKLLGDRSRDDRLEAWRIARRMDATARELEKLAKWLDEQASALATAAASH